MICVFLFVWSGSWLTKYPAQNDFSSWENRWVHAGSWFINFYNLVTASSAQASTSHATSIACCSLLTISIALASSVSHPLICLSPEKERRKNAQCFLGTCDEFHKNGICTYGSKQKVHFHKMVLPSHIILIKIKHNSREERKNEVNTIAVCAMYVRTGQDRRIWHIWKINLYNNIHKHFWEIVFGAPFSFTRFYKPFFCRQSKSNRIA